jgi:hypothetical protein
MHDSMSALYKYSPHSIRLLHMFECSRITLLYSIISNLHIQACSTALSRIIPSFRPYYHGIRKLAPAASRGI